MILEVLKDGAEELRRVSVPTLINDETRDLISNMKETMVSAKGIGWQHHKLV